MAAAGNMAPMFLLKMVYTMLLIVLLAEFGSVFTATTGNPSPGCNSVVGVKSGDTCFDISNGLNMSLSSFIRINPNVNCDALFVGQWLCVNGTTI